MRAIDTNVLVRLVIGDDPEQVGRAESFVKTGAWVSVLALAETTWVLGSAYALGHAQLAAIVEMLLHHKDLTLQDADVVEAALELFRSRPGLGFSDCLMLRIARKARHLPLGTFDRALGKIEGTQKV
jgi:predicted nucleic-acid-binding protein